MDAARLALGANRNRFCANDGVSRDRRRFRHSPLDHFHHLIGIGNPSYHFTGRATVGKGGVASNYFPKDPLLLLAPITGRALPPVA